jgi:hypothetical protein
VYRSDNCNDVAGVHDKAFALNGRWLARRKRTVKTLNFAVKGFANIFSTFAVADVSIRTPATMGLRSNRASIIPPAIALPMTNITVSRRHNANALFQAYAESELAAGVAPKGLEQSFAALLEISPSMWSQIKSARPIGDKLARQIERHGGKSAGWLDQAHHDASPSAAQKAFVELAGKAWSVSNGLQRKQLRAHLKAIVDRAPVDSDKT